LGKPIIVHKLHILIPSSVLEATRSTVIGRTIYAFDSKGQQHLSRTRVFLHYIACPQHSASYRSFDPSTSPTWCSQGQGEQCPFPTPPYTLTYRFHSVRGGGRGSRALVDLHCLSSWLVPVLSSMVSSDCPSSADEQSLKRRTTLEISWIKIPPSLLWSF